MAEKKETKVANTTATTEKALFAPIYKIEYTKEPKNIYAKLQRVRVEFFTYPIATSGKNLYAQFEYFTLKDFIPTLNYLMDKYGLISLFNLTTENATLTIIDTENPEEKIVFTSPIADAEVKGCTAVQNLGSVHTYLKRYLYLNAFEICENDVLDSLAGSGTLVSAEASELARKTKERKVNGTNTTNNGVKTPSRTLPTQPRASVSSEVVNEEKVETISNTPSPEDILKNWKNEIRGEIAKRSKSATSIMAFLKNNDYQVSLNNLSTKEDYTKIITFVKSLPTDI